MSEEKAHSKLGASHAKRWLNCAGSILLTEKAPPQKSSKYADEGTDAHSWLEYVLKTETLGLKDVKKPKKKPDFEMERHVQTCVNWVDENWDKKTSELLVETKVDLSFIDEEMFGTLDIAIVREFGTLTITDFKYGAGVSVEAEKNEQLMYYALGIAKLYDFNFEDVELVVVQPRALHEDGPIRSWKCSIDELKTFGELLKKGAARTKSKSAKTFAGEWCQFCPAASICDTLKSKAQESAKSAFDDDFNPDFSKKLPTLLPPQELSPVVVGQTLKNLKVLKAWITSFEIYAQTVLEHGGRVEGFKLVNKKPRRYWNNEADAAKYFKKTLGDRAFDLKSPAQIEKIPSEFIAVKAAVKGMASLVSSGLTVAPESDSRPAIEHIKHVFDDDYQGDMSEEKESDKKEGIKKGRKKSKKESDKKEKVEEDFDLGF